MWFLFIGNGPYHPRGMVPAWRPTLDSGLLDVRWMRADVRFSRLRVAAALILGALGHSRVYGQCEVAEVDVELKVPGMLATDGEVVEYQRPLHVPRGGRRGSRCTGATSGTGAGGRGRTWAETVAAPTRPRLRRRTFRQAAAAADGAWSIAAFVRRSVEQRPVTWATSANRPRCRPRYR